MAIRSGCILPCVFLTVLSILVYEVKTEKWLYRTLQCEDKNGSLNESSAQVLLTHRLGSGGFGDVYGGTYCGDTPIGSFAYEEVAVKFMKDARDDVRTEFNLQADLLSKWKIFQEKKEEDLKAKKEENLKIDDNNGPTENVDEDASCGNIGGLAEVYQVAREPDIGNGMVMQLLGPSLMEPNFRKFCEKYPRLFWKHIAPAMAGCILRLHSVNFVHRDVKPANFLLGSGLFKHHIYISDFGISAFMHEDQNGRYGSPMFRSIDNGLGQAYTYKDDYAALIYSYIYLLMGENIYGRYANEHCRQQIDDKIAFSCILKHVPGGIALDKFLDWARSTDGSRRDEKPEPSQIWAFIKEIQNEVAPLNKNENLDAIDGSDYIYQIFIDNWTFYPIIRNKYKPPTVDIVSTPWFQKPKVFMRLDGIVAYLSRVEPTNLPIACTIHPTNKNGLFVSLLPGIFDLITMRDISYQYVIFTDNIDEVNLLKKFGFFIRYNVQVVTTDKIKGLIKSGDKILETTFPKPLENDTVKVDYMVPFDPKMCNAGKREIALEKWRSSIVDLLYPQKPGSGLLEFLRKIRK